MFCPYGRSTGHQLAGRRPRSCSTNRPGGKVGGRPRRRRRASGRSRTGTAPRPAARAAPSAGTSVSGRIGTLARRAHADRHALLAEASRRASSTGRRRRPPPSGSRTRSTDLLQPDPGGQRSRNGRASSGQQLGAARSRVGARTARSGSPVGRSRSGSSASASRIAASACRPIALQGAATPTISPGRQPRTGVRSRTSAIAKSRTSAGLSCATAAEQEDVLGRPEPLAARSCASRHSSSRLAIIGCRLR